MIRLRAVVVALLTEVVFAVGLAFLLGTNVFWSVSVALPVAALVLLGMSLPRSVEPSWHAPPEPVTGPSYLGASTLASRLSDAVTDQHRFRRRIQPRLARLALAQLRRRPGTEDMIDLSDSRALSVLGPELHRLVTDPGSTMPEPKDLTEYLRQLEDL